MSPDPNDPSSKVDLERRRVPLERKISLKFKEFRGFITEYSSNLSMGGMFIRTTAPKPVGTIFDFELSLTDDFKLVQGIGEVLWVRDVDEGQERPGGMGVRFLDLSSESRRLIQRIVEEQVAHGGTPFELEPPGFPPPPLRPAMTPGTSRGSTQSTLFHATAAPLGPAPPLPTRSAEGPRRPEAPRPPAGASPPAAPSLPRVAAPAPGLTRAAAPPRQEAASTTSPAPGAFTPRSAPKNFDSFPDPPELPIPELPADGGDVLPDLGDSLESETFEGIALVDDDALPARVLAPDEGTALPDLHDPALLEPSWPTADDPAPPTPWTTAPAPPHAAGPPAAGAPRVRVPSGFDEVARAFSQSAAPAEPRGETLRKPPLEVPPEPIRPAAIAPPPSPQRPGLERPSPERSSPERSSPHRPSPPVAAAPPVSNPERTNPERRPPRRRRSWAPLVAALVFLLLGGFAVLYLRFPELLPEWAGGGQPAGGDSTAAPPAPGGGAAVHQQAPPLDAAAVDGTATDAAAPAAATSLPGSAPPIAAAASPAANPLLAASPPASALPAAPAPDGGAAARTALGDDGPRARFTSVEEIWGQRGPLGTVVTIVTNGAVPADAFSHFRLEGANPREVIRLRGVDDRYRRASVAVSTPEVKQVRLGYHAKPDGNELHVVIDLASPRVKLLRSTPVDNRLELLLAAQ